MRFCFTFALLALGLVSVGCETRVSLGTPCRGVDDCSGGLRCYFGRCRAECEDSAECPTGRYCLTVSGTEGACTLPSDVCDEASRRYCEDGLVCEGQVCVSPCTGPTNSCLPGTSCNATVAACLPMSVTPPDGGLPDAGALSDANLDAALGPDAFCEAPQPVVLPATTLCVGKHMACAIVSGQVRCWGAVGGGQLGDGTDSHMPGPYPSCNGHPCTNGGMPSTVLREDNALPLTGVTSLGCGDNVCALTSMGEVLCWGFVAGATVPTAYRYIEGGATELSVGYRHVCARVDGGFQCWGSNLSNVLEWPQADYRLDRRLGNAFPEVSYPVVAEDFAGSERVAAGGYFTCTARCGGVYCQGWSEGAVCGNDPVYREIGMGERIGVRVVVPEGRRILEGHPDDIHAGLVHACVLRGNVVSCFGADQNGALGNDADLLLCETQSTYRCRPGALPIELPAPDLRFIALAHGISSTSCAITEGAGEVYCWGQNEVGQAGQDPVVEGTARWDSAVQGPVRTSTGPLTGVTEVAVGTSSTCARVGAAGPVYCWGANDAGQLGELGTPHDVVTSPLAPPHPLAVQVTFP